MRAMDIGNINTDLLKKNIADNLTDH